MSNIIHFMLPFIDEKFKKVLFLDTDRIAPLLDDFCLANIERGGLIPNVWCFFVGKVQPIALPSTRGEEETAANAVAQRCMYNGHKRLHGQKFQTLVTRDGIIVHIFGPFTGRNYDITMYRHSNIEETIRHDRRFEGFVFGRFSELNYEYFKPS